MTPEQLKTSILQYAIQGKLVEQRLEEGTGEDLYQKIQEEKQKLIKEGKIKKEKPLPEISENELPFDIPESWRWCYVGDLFNHNTGKAMNSSVKKVDKPGAIRPFITTSNVYWNSFDFSTVKEMFFSDDEVERCTVTKGDLLMCEGGAYFGRTAIWSYDYDICFQNHIHRLRPYQEIDLMFYYHVFFFYKSMNMMKAKGTAMPGLSSITLHQMIIPLPPLAEQKRIIAKIEELLPIVDRYAIAYEKLEKFNEKFPEDMKKAILQYAIQGKLVEQRTEEGTGEELYQKIQLEKQNLIENGKIKKEKPLSEIAEDEKPFDIPETWKWVRLGDCTGYAQTKEKISPSDIEDDMWSLDLEDIEKDTGAILVQTRASERKITGEKVVFRKGQVLYSKLRPYLKKILVAPDDGICTPELVPFYTYLIDADFIAYVLRSPHIDYVINTVTYGVKMPRVGTDTMVNLLIPLPPLAEQKRIVAKIEELLPYCDRLVK